MKKITQKQLDSLKKRIKKDQKAVYKLEMKYFALERSFNLQKSGRPAWNSKKFIEKPLNTSNAHETEAEWWDTGTFMPGNGTERGYNVHIWVCKFCKTPLRKKYIATGHDHTDYSFDVCDCKGAAKFGAHYDDLE